MPPFSIVHGMGTWEKEKCSYLRPCKYKDFQWIYRHSKYYILQFGGKKPLHLDFSGRKIPQMANRTYTLVRNQHPPVRNRTAGSVAPNMWNASTNRGKWGRQTLNRKVKELHTFPFLSVIQQNGKGYPPQKPSKILTRLRVPSRVKFRPNCEILLHIVNKTQYLFHKRNGGGRQILPLKPCF